MDLFSQSMICVGVSLVSFVWMGWRHNKLPLVIKNNPKRSVLWYNSRFVLGVIMHPAFEELIFRLPLILFFSEFTTGAVISIVVSGLVFAAMHNTLLDDECISWSFTNWRAIAERTCLRFIFGALIGIIAILTQSLFVAVLLHALINCAVWITLQWRFQRADVSTGDKILFSEWYMLKLRCEVIYLKLRIKLMPK